jgi:hypothetical protein
MSLYDTLMAELADFNLGVFSKAEQERRIAICQSCENYTGDETHRCGVCKCNINWNVLFTPNSCPLGKWVAPRQD